MAVVWTGNSVGFINPGAIEAYEDLETGEFLEFWHRSITDRFCATPSKFIVSSDDNYIKKKLQREYRPDKFKVRGLILLEFYESLVQRRIQLILLLDFYLFCHSGVCWTLLIKNSLVLKNGSVICPLTYIFHSCVSYPGEEKLTSSQVWKTCSFTRLQREKRRFPSINFSQSVSKSSLHHDAIKLAHVQFPVHKCF